MAGELDAIEHQRHETGSSRSRTRAGAASVHPGGTFSMYSRGSAGSIGPGAFEPSAWASKCSHSRGGDEPLLQVADAGQVTRVEPVAVGRTEVLFAGRRADPRRRPSRSARGRAAGPARAISAGLSWRNRALRKTSDAFSSCRGSGRRCRVQEEAPLPSGDVDAQRERGEPRRCPSACSAAYWSSEISVAWKPALPGWGGGEEAVVSTGRVAAVDDRGACAR